MNLTEERRQSLTRIYNHHGMETQILKTIEELAELIGALATGTKEDVITEMADVEIMVEQLKIGADLELEVEAEITRKINRQLSRDESESKLLRETLSEYAPVEVLAEYLGKRMKTSGEREECDQP